MLIDSLAFIAVAYLPLASALPAIHHNQLQIRTSSGHIHGHIDHSAPNVRKFLGVPYALPPTDSLRWEPPAPYCSSNVIKAISIGPACPQLPLRNAWVYSTNGGNMTEYFSLENYSEDCLTLNVWAPYSPGIEESGLPVIVWFFGGGFTQGGTNSLYFDPTSWINRSKSHIVVTVNFRSNIFGFPGSTFKPNLGLLDQRLALEWIRDNIAGFGGDRNRIIGWGESAGAIAVDWLSFACEQDPIMSGIILDSTTSLFAPSTSITDDLKGEDWKFVADAVGCGSPAESQLDMVDCMRRVPWRTIEGAISTNSSLRFLPVMDDKLVYANYTRQYEVRNSPVLPAIIGINKHESNALIPHLSGTPSHEAQYDAFDNTTYLCASAALSSSLRRAKGGTTYRYRYDGNFTNLSPPEYPGAYHASELPMIFGTAGDYHGISTPYEKRVSEEMQDLWVEFAKDPYNGLKKSGWGSYEDGKAVLLGGNRVPVEQIDIEMLDGNCRLGRYN